MPTRRQSDFFAFPCSEQPVITGCDLRMKPCRHERAHGQHGAPLRAPTPPGAPAPQRPTVAMEGRHTHQGRDWLPRECPQLGQFQQERPSTHRPHAGDTLQEIIVFAPQRAGPEHPLQVIVQRGATRLEPGPRALYPDPDALIGHSLWLLYTWRWLPTVDVCCPLPDPETNWRTVPVHPAD